MPSPAASEVRLSAIGQIAINVHDLPRAVSFYRDALGLPFLFEAPPAMAFFRCGDIRLLLGVPEKPESAHSSSILYFKVDDIQVAHRSLTGRGVRFNGEPHLVHRTPNLELWLAFFPDSEGNVLALMCEKKIDG